MLSAELLCCGGPSRISSLQEGSAACGAAGRLLRDRAEAPHKPGMVRGAEDTPVTRLVSICIGHRYPARLGNLNL